MISKETTPVSVPQRFQLVTKVTTSLGAPLTKIQITLKNSKGYAVKSALSSSGTATFTNVLPGIYKVGAYKYRVISTTTAPFDVATTPTITIAAP